MTLWPKLSAASRAAARWSCMPLMTELMKTFMHLPSCPFVVRSAQVDLSCLGASAVQVAPTVPAERQI